MTKAAIIISAILVFAGIAAAGTLSSSGGGNSPTIGTATLPTTTSDEVRQRDHRANEAGEDLRGPCDEAEHANDPRCTGASAGTDTRGADDGVNDNGHHAQNSGHGAERGDDNGSSGHGGGNSGHGGGSDD